jgi:hypothetical protein
MLSPQGKVTYLPERATMHVSPAVGIPGDPSGCRVAVECKKGCLIQRYKKRVQASHAEGRKHPLFGTSLDDGTIGIDGCRPKPLHWVPSEMIVQDQIRESSIRMLPVAELIVHDPAIERSAGETRLSNEHVTRHVGGG